MVLVLGSLTFRQGHTLIRAAQSVSCITHLQQFAVATDLYLNDHLDYLPHEDFGSTGKFPKGACWVDVLGLAPYDAGYGEEDNSYSLKMNSRLEDYKGTKFFASGPFRSMNTIDSPSQVPYIFEGKIDKYNKNRTYGMHKTTENHHSDKVNFLFLDGSSRSIWGIPQQEKGGWTNTNDLWWDPDAPLEDQLNN